MVFCGNIITRESLLQFTGMFCSKTRMYQKEKNRNIEV
jgi:hypothetical protein